MKSRQFDLWVLLTLSCLYVMYCLPLLSEAADDIAMVGVFSLDESAAAQVVNKVFNGGMTTKPPFTYGGLYYYCPLIVLHLLSLFGTVSEHVIIVVLRSMGMVFGLGCLGMVYCLGRLVFDRLTGLLAAALLLPLPVFLRWSVEAHPDLPQLFWILCSLYVCCRMTEAFRARDAWLSAGFAGLAFGTKYGGLFLLPVIGLSIVFIAKRERGWPALVQAPFLWGWLGIPIAFGLAFAVTNPHAILDPMGLYAQVVQENAIMTFGHTIQSDQTGWAWFALIFDVMGYLNGLVLVGVVGVVLMRKMDGVSTRQIILLLWGVILMLYLVVEVRVFYPRHLLPILPVLLLVASLAYKTIAEWCVHRVGGAQWLFLVPIVVFGSIQPAGTSWAMFGGKKGRAQESSELVAGSWVGEAFAEDTTILFDAYAYVPGKFKQSRVIIPAHTFSIVNHFEPDIIVLRDSQFNRFKDLSQADRSRVGRKTFYDIHYFYRFIKEGLIPDYELAKRFDGVAVYQRVGPRNHTLSFDECLQLFAEKKMVNPGRAREILGDIHFSRLEWALAADEYEYGTEVVPNNTTLHYKLGRALIANGDLERGKTAFAGALKQIVSITDVEWGNIHLDMAQSYFASGFYSEAQQEIRKTLEYRTDLASAHFDLGACLLALGRVKDADAVYRDAVDQFGPDTIAVVKLRVLRDEEKYAKEVQRLLETYFNVKDE